MVGRLIRGVGGIIVVAAMGVVVARASAGPMQEEYLYDLPEPTDYVSDFLSDRLDQALGQPDAVTLIEALNDVALYEVSGLAERVSGLLDDPRDPIRNGAVAALIASDARQYAEKMLRLTQWSGAASSGEVIERIQRIDLALGKWRVRAGVEVWVDRVGRELGPRALQWSAATALGSAGFDDAAVIDVLRAAVVDRGRAIEIRMAAAEALGKLRDAELEPTAARLSEESTAGAMMATRVLKRHGSAEAIEQLHGLAQHTEPAVQGEAMRQLFAIDVALVWRYRALAVASGDPEVRLVNVRALAERHELDSIDLLLTALDDAHPMVRDSARVGLHVLSNDADLFEVIRDGLRRILTDGLAQHRTREPTHWRAVEQAALLIGHLDDQTMAETLLVLVDYPRLEARLAAVDALRRLAPPAMRGPMVDLQKQQMRRIKAGVPGRHYSDAGGAEDPNVRIAHEDLVGGEVAQTLGVWDVREATPLFVELIPKVKKVGHAVGREYFRAGAIWALGMIYEDDAPAGIAEAIAGRMNDDFSLDPEYTEVRVQSVIAIGRMKAMAHAEDMHKRVAYLTDDLRIRAAGRWAYERMKGVVLEQPKLEPVAYVSSFYSPVNRNAGAGGSDESTDD
ncbi:MAG: hypothetical protein CMJ49_07495 [Planctomycetaceae bacterium]|nr:hypothetical protein [Planctomycetaceae bacterium]